MNREIPDAPAQNNVIINLPVNITYAALVDVLREKVRGEIIQVEKENGETTRYAEILDVSFEQSLLEKYDLTFNIEFKTLTTVFKNKTGRIFMDAAIHYNEQEQVVLVSDFKLDVKSGNWLMNNSLEAVANKFMHDKIKRKMQLDLRPEIEKHIAGLNSKLEDPYELIEGIHLFAKIENFSIGKIIPKPLHFLVLLNLHGNAVVDVDKISLP